jgi:hypothetical protein
LYYQPHMRPPSPIHEPAWRPKYPIAIPAKDEAGVIERCLLALAMQDSPDLPEMGVLLLVNNTGDRTASLARQLRPSLPYALRIVDVNFAQSDCHAGSARRLAMDLAERWSDAVPGNVILTTDADSCVASDWLTANLSAISRGADAVAGHVEYGLENDIPVIRDWKVLEEQYEKLVAEIDARLDPVPHNPWPRHQTESGASLAIRGEAYRLIGGLPKLPVGEDRGLCAAVVSHGLRLRHAVDVKVVTSARLQGRASGGAAACLRLRYNKYQTSCDDRLAAVSLTVRRARLRHRLRQAWRAGMLTVPVLAAYLRISTEKAEELAAMPSFHALWEDAIIATTYLRGEGLQLAQLPLQIRRAKILLHVLRARDKLRWIAAGDRDDTARSGFAKAPA